jgi:CDP-glycerol glycerophosphotransferase (TagB/SpsB family)
VSGPPQLPLRERVTTRVIAALNRASPKAEAKIVLAGMPDLEDGLMEVARAVIERGWRPTVLLADPAKAGAVRERLGGAVRTVPMASPRAIVEFVTARYVFVTHGIYGALRPPAGQTVVNLWHGEPPTKVIARFEGGPPIHASITPVMSTVGRAYRSAEFGLDPQDVPILGAPRNDRMLRADGPAIRRRVLGGAADRPAYLWLPTYRATRGGMFGRVDTAERHPGVPFDRAAVEQIDRGLAELGVSVVVKLHPLDATDFAGPFEALKVLVNDDLDRLGISPYELLAGFDGLITDLSSVWIDHLLLDRPLVFAFPDVEAYRRGRGINLEPYEDWVPGPFVRTPAELLAAVGRLAAGEDDFAELRGRTRRMFHAHRDDRSTARVLDAAGVARRR